MYEKQLDNEITYQVTMIQMKSLLKKGIVTQAEFDQFKQMMLEKYHPFISKLSC